jgi:hypothetical protein
MIPSQLQQQNIGEEYITVCEKRFSEFTLGYTMRILDLWLEYSVALSVEKADFGRLLAPCATGLHGQENTPPIPSQNVSNSNPADAFPSPVQNVA